MKKRIMILYLIATLCTLAACGEGNQNIGTTTQTGLVPSESSTSHVHSFSRWVITVEADCTNDGTQERSCACGEIEREVIPAIGHDILHGLCRRCNQVISEQLAYLPNQEGTGYIVAGIGSWQSSELTIPTEYQGLPVTGIDSGAFYLCDQIVSVVIPDSISAIADGSFKMCSNLKEVTIGAGVSYIGQEAFANCDALTQIYIPGNVERIGDGAFGGCGSLTSIIMENGVQELEEYVFRGCVSLTEISFPDSIQRIGENVFSGCQGLKTIQIPEKAVQIDCDFMDTAYYADLESWSDGALFIGKHLVALDWEQVGLNYAVPEGTVTVGGGLLLNNEDVQSVSLPDSLLAIGYGAFAYCHGLESVSFGKNLQIIGTFAFEDCQKLTTLDLPNSLTIIGGGAFADCSGLERVHLPESVTTIESSAFSNCSGLKTVTMGNNVRVIGNGAFRDCKNLENISLSNTLQVIENQAFSGCEKIENITLPQSLQTIGATAFAYCKNLVEIEVPEAVISIGWKAFADCEMLTKLTVPFVGGSIDGFVDGYPQTELCYLFGNDWADVPASLKTVVITGSVVGDGAFKNCIGLKNVVLSDHIQSVGRESFCGCNSLEKIVFSGTKEQWDSIEKGTDWNKGISCDIECADGTVPY